MRLLTCLCILTLTVSTLLAAEPTPEQQFCEAWNIYKSSPTEENARTLCTLLGAELYEAALRADTGCFEHFEDDLMIVGNELMANNSSAFPLALRLIQFTYGEDKESTLDGIGHYARMNPRVFLTAYIDVPADSSVLDASLSRVCSWYDIDKGYVIYELRERLKSLSAVSDKRLRVYRDRCVQILEQVIEQKVKGQ